MLTSLFNIARGTVLLLGVIAFGAFAWVYNEQVETEKAQLAVEARRAVDAEREVALYQALLAAGPEGLDLAALQGDASEADTLRGLLALTAKGVIRLTADGTYAIVMARPDRENPFARNQALAEAVLDHVASTPDGLTLAEIRTWLMTEHELTRLEAAQVLKPLLSPAVASSPMLTPSTVLPAPILPEQKLKVAE